MALLLSLLANIGMKLLTAAALEDFLVFVAEKVAAHTDTKADDDLVNIIKKHLGK
jgi:hypothetical protein